VTREILHKPGDPKLLLEETYDVPGAVPRSFFVVMAHRGIAHSFIFDFPDHAWFHDLAGLRKVSKTGCGWVTNNLAILDVANTHSQLERAPI
jgi:hypothetical protein